MICHRFTPKQPLFRCISPSPLLLLLTLVWLTACQTATPVADPLRGLSQPLNIAEIEAFIGAPFPAQATNLQTAGEAALDTMVIARLDLPEALLTPFLEQLGTEEPLEVGYTPFPSTAPPYPEAEPWWDVPPIQSALGYQGLSFEHDGKFFHLLVIPLDANTVTLYLQVFNT